MKEKDNILPNHGKKPNQRMKHFLVLQYLMQETDQDHPATVEDITEYLKSQGIYAERRSVYKDIKEINIDGWECRYANNNYSTPSTIMATNCFHGSIISFRVLKVN